MMAECTGIPQIILDKDCSSWSLDITSVNIAPRGEMEEGVLEETFYSHVKHEAVESHGICSSGLLFHNHGSRLIT